MDLEDESLVAKYLENGCQNALDALMDRYIDGLKPLLMQLGVHSSDVPDLTQEILLKAFRGLSGFKRQAKFRTWLMSIAIRSVKDYLRKQKREAICRSQPLSHNLEAAEAEPVDEDKETIDRIDAAIASLKEHHRTAIVLICLQQLSPDEAAKICGCSRNAIYFRLHAARNKLKRALKGILQ